MNLVPCQKQPNLKREASLQRFLHKLKQNYFFHEKEYDKSYPPGSALACIYGTPRMHKFSSSHSFPKLRPIILSISTFNSNLERFLCDLLSPLVPNRFSCKETFLLFVKLRMEIFPKNFLFPTM